MRNKLDLLSSETPYFTKKFSMQSVPLKRGCKVDVFSELKKLLKKNLEGVVQDYLNHLIERYKAVFIVSGKNPESA